MAKVNKSKITTYLKDFADPSFPLKIWRDKIDILIKIYGEEAVLFTDAGYNNVEFAISK